MATRSNARTKSSDTRGTKARSERKFDRVPVGGHRQRLTISDDLKDPNYVYRFVSDEPGNIDRYQRAGYEFVEDPNIEVGDDGMDPDHGQPIDRTISVAAGRTRTQLNGRLYLMRIRKEYYEEDMEAKRAERDETKRAMFRADPSLGQYVKEFESSVTRGRK